jgi:alkanesulfonate monooxygenase SsuD/methylene tetrahydromethanopterin reductase-like flavin-dependent oxidoreductase (luciferase family)
MGSSAARECCYELARKLTEPLSCDRPLRDRPAHDERLWMGITKANGALGNTSCLVGTAERVADSLLAYYRLGVSSFLIRGFDPVSDTVESGRD